MWQNNFIPLHHNSTESFSYFLLVVLATGTLETILSSIAPLHHNDGWVFALGSPDLMLPQQNNVRANTENKKGWNNGAMPRAVTEKERASMLSENAIAKTTQGQHPAGHHKWDGRSTRLWKPTQGINSQCQSPTYSNEPWLGGYVQRTTLAEPGVHKAWVQITTKAKEHSISLAEHKKTQAEWAANVYTHPWIQEHNKVW